MKNYGKTMRVDVDNETFKKYKKLCTDYEISMAKALGILICNELERVEKGEKLEGEDSK